MSFVRPETMKTAIAGRFNMQSTTVQVVMPNPPSSVEGFKGLPERRACHNGSHVATAFCHGFWTVRKNKAQFIEQDARSLFRSADKSQADLPFPLVGEQRGQLHDFLTVCDWFAWRAAQPRQAHPRFRAHTGASERKPSAMGAGHVQPCEDSLLGCPGHSGIRRGCSSRRISLYHASLGGPEWI